MQIWELTFFPLIDIALAASSKVFYLIKACFWRSSSRFHCLYEPTRSPLEMKVAQKELVAKMLRRSQLSSLLISYTTTYFSQYCHSEHPMSHYNNGMSHLSDFMDALSDPRTFLSNQEKYREDQLKAMGIDENDISTDNVIMSTHRNQYPTSVSLSSTASTASLPGTRNLTGLPSVRCPKG